MDTCKNFRAKKKVPAKVEEIPKTTISEMKENLRLLKEKTLLPKYCPDFEKLESLIDFPFGSFKLDPQKHFMREEEETKKKKITICTTRKAAFLW